MLFGVFQHFQPTIWGAAPIHWLKYTTPDALINPHSKNKTKKFAGINILSNKFYYLNNRIKIDFLNLTVNVLKNPIEIKSETYRD